MKPLHTSPPSTKVTYITQESVKGWIPGLTKKSLARRPLVIADVQNYLHQKAERSKDTNRFPASSNLTQQASSDITHGDGTITTSNTTTTATYALNSNSTLLTSGGQRRPSIMAQQQQPKSILQKTPSSK